MYVCIALFNFLWSFCCCFCVLMSLSLLSIWSNRKTHECACELTHTHTRLDALSLLRIGLSHISHIHIIYGVCMYTLYFFNLLRNVFIYNCYCCLSLILFGFHSNLLIIRLVCDMLLTRSWRNYYFYYIYTLCARSFALPYLYWVLC